MKKKKVVSKKPQVEKKDAQTGKPLPPIKRKPGRPKGSKNKDNSKQTGGKAGRKWKEKKPAPYPNNSKPWEVRTMAEIQGVLGIEEEIPEFLYDNLFDETLFNEDIVSSIEKKIILNVLISSMGNKTIASKVLGFNSRKFYSIVQEDSYFSECVDEVYNILLDWTERNLFKLIKNGDRQCIMFYLKTKGKNRGYVERVETINQNIEPITINIDEKINDINIVEINKDKKNED